MIHKFHIPVLGLSFSIDSPIKVAQYGISSAVSIVDDQLTERLRQYHSKLHQLPFIGIGIKEFDARARRLTAYLDMMQDIIDQQIETLKSAAFSASESLHQYFKLLPDNNPAYKLYQKFIQTTDDSQKEVLESTLKTMIQAGKIDVNIMSKVDKVNRDEEGRALESIYSDATAALRGYTNSKINSSLVLSAGMNPKLYNYLAELPHFLPNVDGTFTKKVCLKVSDYRSANIQAKYLAKKGIWVSEFRVESGLNCGGHAFATEGFLLGPILEEFKQNHKLLIDDLFSLYANALQAKNITLQQAPQQVITAQGGVGTGEEQHFLLEYYQLNSIGWGSPFLLVPEATTVDDDTLGALVAADKNDFYLSGASPLGVPFNNFRKSTAESQRLARIANNRAGAPCTKKYLVSNEEFSTEPICTASRVYQHRKLQELAALAKLSPQDSAVDFEKKKQEITEKACLCEGLASSAYLKYDIAKRKENTAVAICPGPNTAYFNSTYSLAEMTNHIYGRTDLLKDVKRSSLFINELRLYVTYLDTYSKNNPEPDDKKKKYMDAFRQQLLNGILYYKELASPLFKNNTTQKESFLQELIAEEVLLNSFRYA